MVDVTPLPPVSIPNSEVRTLSSESVGQEYRILIALPMKYAESNDRYPVLYVLDADMMFGWITELVRSAASVRALGILGSDPSFPLYLPNLILVGIGYPTSWFEQPKLWWSLRTRDLTPTQNPEDARALGLKGTFGGNARKFLGFMRNELMPVVNSNYRTNPKDSTIVGHSGGGLFALSVLFHQPETFRRYVVSSPSLWWDNKVVFEYEREYASKHTELSGRLFLSVGSLEGPMVSNLKELVKILEQRKYVGLEWESHIFEDEGHFSVGGTAICRGISTVFSKLNTKRT
jgi:predicted alpha/beta superfamily hydrolase